MNNFLKEYQEFYKTLKTLPASISKRVVEDLSRIIIEKYMDLYDLISEQNCNCKCSIQTDTSSQMEDINNLLEQLDHIKNESERIAADNIELRKQNDKLHKMLENNSNEQILKNQIHIAELINYMFNELYQGTNKTIEENWFRGKVEDIIKDTKKVLEGR